MHRGWAGCAGSPQALLNDTEIQEQLLELTTEGRRRTGHALNERKLSEHTMAVQRQNLQPEGLAVRIVDGYRMFTPAEVASEEHGRFSYRDRFRRIAKAGGW